MAGALMSWNDAQLTLVQALSRKVLEGEALTPEEQAFLCEYCWTELVDRMLLDDVPDTEVHDVLERYLGKEGAQPWDLHVLEDNGIVVGFQIVDENGELIYEPRD